MISGARLSELIADGPLPTDRLLTIAAKCPVHKALAAETPVTVVDRVVRR